MIDAWTEVVGFGAYIANVVGNVLLIYKRGSGFDIRIVSIVLWGIYGLGELSPAVLANSITFFGINCYGAWKWRRGEGAAG